MTNKTVLVTGAAGYLGSLIVERLLKDGFKVRGLDQRPDALEILSPVTFDPRFYWIAGDVRDKEVMKFALKGADVIIPTAAIVGAAKCDKDPELAWEVNFESIRLLNTLRIPEQAVLFPMTNNGYQSGSHVTEESPWTDNGSLYTRSKFEAEQLLLKSPNAVSFRLASLFGISPAMRWDLLIHFLVRSAFAEKEIDLFDADFKRSFVHARDVADCFAFAARSSGSMNGIYNVGLENGNVSKRELVRQIAALYHDFKIKENLAETDPDARDFFISVQKLKQAGFSASRQVSEGILEILTFLKSHDLTLRGVA